MTQSPNLKGEMPKKYLKMLGGIAICFLAALTMAETASDNNPADILATTLRNKTRLNYKLTAVKNYPELYLTAEESYYNQALPDGTSNTRYEEDAKKGGVPGGETLTVIKNAEGTFRIHSGNVYKLNYEEAEKGFTFKDVPTQGESADYKMQDDTVGGHDCYKITKRIKPDAAAFENYKKFLPEWYVRKNQGKLKNECKEQFPVVQVYYIDKKKLLPWKYEFYNIGGKKVFAQEFQKIDVLDKISPDLFAIPSDANVQIYSDPDNYEKASEEAVSEAVKEHIKTKSVEVLKKELRKEQEKARKDQLAGPGFFAGISAYIDANFNSIIPILSTVLFLLAMGLFAFVGIYKFCRRKRGK